jgi:hypothetical protein
MLLAQRIERAHEVVEIVDDLLGRQRVRHRRESHHIGEQDAEIADAVGDTRFGSGLKPFRD